ncbi:MAG: AAA domain-containing protein [Armatimonadota bacterium]
MSVRTEGMGHRVAAGETRAAAVARACEGWVRRLYDLSRRNNLLFFRDLSRGTLDLTAADLSALLAGEAVSFTRLLPGTDPVKLGMSVQEIRRRALANLEEKGLNTLYLALGLATWATEDEGRAPAATVLLVPVAIERHGRDGRSFAIARTGEAQVNPVLLHLLANQFGCEVDEDALLDAPDDEPFNPAAVYAKLAEAAREVAGFGVDPRAVLGNFAFQKMAMVQDLQERVEELAAHDLIATLAGDGQARAAVTANRTEVDPAGLDRISPDDEFLVFDADSSQQRVIAAVLAGQSGVIQGPPGTGKSQTIANLIASLVAAGRRVLFVAEKRAALDVVLHRLERAGLGRLALDLHGADISRQQVMRRLAESLALVRDAAPAEYEELHVRFIERRRRLTEHAERMNAARPPSGLSAFAILGRLLRVPPEEQCKTRWRGAHLAALDAKAAERVRELLTEAGGFGGLLTGADPSPWAEAALPDGAAVQLAQELVERLLRERMPALRAALASLPEMCPPATVDELRNLAGLLNDIAATLGHFRPELFAEDLNALATDYAPSVRNAFGRWLKRLSDGRYREACLKVQALKRADLQPPALLQVLKTAAKQLHRWRTLSSAPAPADNAAARQALDSAVTDLTALEPLLPAHKLFTLSLDDAEGLLASLDADRQTPLRLPRLREIQHELTQLGIGPLLEEIRAGRPEPARWPRMFDYAWLASCLDAARYEDAAIGGFNGRAHERFVEEFCELDRRRLQAAAARVRRAHGEHAVEVMNRFPDQEALVRREAEKKSRHLPLRSLLAQAPDVLTALCPCWMASPLSVSQLLGADRRYFDVVIFDEASQVLPEDAVPALLRATQAVVAGDKHQLPPTIFFMPGEADEPAEEAAPTEGFESLLDLLSAFLEPWSLEWHYRSRDEALIAFSNHHIYDDRLVTFPGVGKSVAVSHVLVNEPGEDTDSSAAEVRRVVELVLEHAQQRPHETLGVIALGIKHAARIQDALDDALDAHPELDDFFSEQQVERFFVKNLERVQGDERDAIILSVGYAKDKSGKVPYRFGPLLTAGGERRLNVAITRARERLTLVSSFDHTDMDPARSSARGVELLRAYLEYAAHHGRSLRDRQSAEAEDPFLADVASALAAAGVPVRTHWGTSRYRLECAAPHPDRPERLVLAVETDGGAYASAPTARDRDRLRRQQLQSLGWSFTRLWAVDWLMRRDEELARLVQTYRTAVAKADGDDAGAENEAQPAPAPPAPEPAADPAPAPRGRKPRVTKQENLADYGRRDLVMLIRWLHSDGRLRTDEEILDELTGELGFKRRGPKAEEVLRAAIEDWKRIEKLV